MKFVFINASPKQEDSLSGVIVERLRLLIGGQIPTFQAIRLVNGETPPDALSQILAADALVFVFPLYVDGLPAPLIELLTRLQRAGDSDRTQRIYAVVNCGFYEARQTQLALQMMRLFADQSGRSFGCGVGIGCGPMLTSMGADWSRGPAATVQSALADLSSAICEGKSGRDAYVVPKFPRLAYRFMAHMGFRAMAKRNKAAGKLRARPYA